MAIAKKDYKPGEVEAKWQKVWEQKRIYSPDLNSAKKPFYNLMMFPYPSAEGMHVGNMYAFTGADVYGRFMRMRGWDVFEPIGLDGFGIHSENYAIKVGRHPKEQAKISEANFYRQLRATGNGFDWSRKLETYDPEYYKWTQWLFIQLFKAGLAYRAKAKVNWCPSCKTVLADEQVVKKSKVSKNVILNSFQNPVSSGKEIPKQVRDDNEEIAVCERCETEVIKKDLEQWFFRITKYADRLLNNIDKLDWSEKVKIAQRQWIGKSEGARIKFSVIASPAELGEAISDLKGIASSALDKLGAPRNDKPFIEVYTTRPDTLFGATFIVLSPEHPVVASLLESRIMNQESRIREINTYVDEAKKKTEQERLAEGKDPSTHSASSGQAGSGQEKTGVFTGLYAINPVNNEKIPIWIADYVLMEYGTGAIMAVPAHDQRDYEFAKKYGLSINQVIIPTKKSAFADGLVGQTDLLDDRLDNLKQNITQKMGFVKGVDLPGVEPGRPGLSSRSSKPAKPTPKIAYTDFGILVNSGEYSGLSSEDAIEKITNDLEKRVIAKKEVIYHLRDWLISRQRYWGPPIPMIFCQSCAKKGNSWFTSKQAEVSQESRIKNQESRKERNHDSLFMIHNSMRGWYPDENLPVLLPDVKDWKPLGIHSASSGQAVRSPLANHPEFYKVKCPNCGGDARRETDVSDTFLDSSWYFLRYLGTEFDYIPFPSKDLIPEHSENSENQKRSDGQNIRKPDLSDNPIHRRTESSEFSEIEKRLRWLPVTMYVGGAEHSVLHLLYSRFITMVLHDLGFISFEEPFTRFFAHGLLIKERAKMSKSKGNVVIPDEYIRKFGADTLRMYLMFLGPFSQGGDFYDTALEGMHRFVRRVWTLLTQSQKSIPDSIGDKSQKLSEERLRTMHKTIKKVTEDIENLRYNTAIASLMEWHNYLKSKVNPSTRRVPDGNPSSSGQKSKITIEETEVFLKLLAPFAPHVTEQLLQLLRGQRSKVKGQRFESIHLQPWPKYDSKYLEEDEVTIAVQVDGKVRDVLRIQKHALSGVEGSKVPTPLKLRGVSKSQKFVEDTARESEKVRRHLEGKEVRKVVYVEGKVINFVTV